MKSGEKSLKVERICRKISAFLLLFTAVVIFTAGFTTAAADCGEVVSGRNANIYKNTPQITTFTAKRSTYTEKYDNNLHFATTEEGFSEETLPEEYGDFIGSLPDSVIDRLPEGAMQDDGGALTDAAAEASGVSYLLGIIFDAFGGVPDGIADGDERIHIRRSVPEILKAVDEVEGVAVITADHGNAEEMLDKKGNVLTSHTTNPVPLWLISEKYNKAKLKKDGKLCNVAPTVLELLGLDIPEYMQESLIK